MYWASSETHRKYFCVKEDLCSVGYSIGWRRTALCIFDTAQHIYSAANEVASILSQIADTCSRKLVAVVEIRH